jgi:uncharacterized ubiquitin-like protein YukD
VEDAGEAVMLEIPILQHIYEPPPDIDRSRIPADQMPVFLHVVTLLMELGAYERHLLLASYLYEFSQTALREIKYFAQQEWASWTTGGWQMMAARDGALTIYHFGCAIDGLKNSLRFCPALTVDQTIRIAGKVFDVAFPDSKEIRNAIAHVADNSQTLQKKLSHAVKGVFRGKWFFSRTLWGSHGFLEI